MGDATEVRECVSVLGWRRRRRRRKRGKESRWPSADRLRDWERGVFSEGQGLALLWLRGPLCHTAYQGSPKSRGLMVSVSPQSSSPSPGLLWFLFFNFSNAIKCDTNCLPSVSATTRKRKGGERKNRHKPGSRHKIILHNTREFKEALPTPPRTPSAPSAALCSYEKRRGGDKGEKKAKKEHIRRKLLNSPLSLIWDC